MINGTAVSLVDMPVSLNDETSRPSMPNGK